MKTCVICHFDVPDDDALVPTESGHCICFSCYIREVGQDRPMPPALRRQISAVLEAAEAV